MLLQKTLHMSQSLAECKARLASIQSYRRQFPMVTRATVTSSKTVDFSFRGPLGFEAHTVLLSVESDSPDQYTFESVAGNINLMGIVDFAEIRPNCTEVTFAVHYEIRNKLFAWLDRRLRFLDTFVTAQLRSIRALENGTTGFRIWDALERKTATNQVGTLNRWNKGEQTA
jgi:ribosome-associated toxin RatA of RatAB toxin-antitoxin module